MKQGRINLVHNFLGETNYVIITWQSTVAPLTEIGREVYPAPHSQEALLIEDLDPILHLVRAYRSTDGTTLNTQINELACDAGARSTYSSTTYEYIVDGGDSGVDPTWSDPASGQIELRDERLLNQSYAVFMRGLGQRRADEIADRSDDGGGFDLAVTDELFNTLDTIFVTVQNRVDGVETGSGSGSSGEVGDVIFIDTDQDFDPVTMAGKLVYADYASSVVGVLTFPNLSLIPDCNFKVATHGGLQKCLSLQLDAGDTVRFMSDDRNVIHLGKSEEVGIMIRNNVMYVLSDGTNYKRLGQRVWGDKLELNSLYRDGSTYDQDYYPRLMEFIDSLPGANVLSYGSWATDKGKFARDDIAGTFKVPDDREMFVRAIAVDGSIIPGRKQDDTVGPVTVPVNQGNSYTGTGGAGIVGRGAADPNTFNISINPSGETRPDNIGLLPLIII